MHSIFSIVLFLRSALAANRTLLLAIFMLDLLTGSVHAGTERCATRLTGSSITPTKLLVANDSRPNQTGTTVIRGLGRVTLGVDQNQLTYVSSAYTVRVEVSLRYKYIVNATTKSAFTAFTPNQILEVTYDPASAVQTQNDRHSFELNTSNLPVGQQQVVSIEATVVAVRDGNNNVISTIPKNLYLEAATEVERYGVINPSLVPAATDLRLGASFNTANELEVSWSVLAGAEDYDLEWTYVNDFDANGNAMSPTTADAQLRLDFEHNATRVTLSGNSFNVPLVFDQGYLAFRLRAASYVLDGGQLLRVTGAWTYTPPAPLSFTGLPDYLKIPTLSQFRAANTSHVFYISAGHRKRLNWQYNAVYAEEGKKKEVVSYYDGSLRNRQTVTKTSSEKKLIVGETIYDHEGRGAITVLPAPVAGANPAINFVLGFNLNTITPTPVTYNRNNFDLDANSCQAIAAGAMSTTNGAAQYYSPQNPEQTNAQRFLPNAGGFPFTQVEYMPDNTGRVRRQSGVGPDHELGSGHETKYYYGQPAQEELDRLFGADVGFSKHYNKVVTVDANGQTSVSYVDQEGRTIATGLAGNATDPQTGLALPLDPLKENGSGTLTHQARQMNNFTVDLLSKLNDNAVDTDQDNNQLTVNGDALELNMPLLVTGASTYNFTYSLDGVAFTPACAAICYNCVYDLEIDVKDACGVSAQGFPVSQTVGSFNTTCSAGNLAQFDFSPSPISVALTPGTYTVVKRLKINQTALDSAIADYIRRSACAQQKDAMITAAIAAVDVSGCNTACAECQEYISPCEASFQALLTDVSPYGQYAEYKDANGNNNPGIHLLSVLNDGTGNLLPKANANWRNPKYETNNNPNYYEADGLTISRIPVTILNGNYLPAIQNVNDLTDANGAAYSGSGQAYVLPQKLANVEDFVFYWKDSWAMSLVTYHPEYCYYEWCKGYATTVSGNGFSSDLFDELFLQTPSLVSAQSVGYDNPLGASSAVSADPYFHANGTGASQYTQMQTAMSNYNGSGMSIWKMARFMRSCGTWYNASSSQLTITCLPGTQTIEKNWLITDQDWENFKMLYYSLKQSFQSKAANSSALLCQGFNGCIGNDQFSPLTSDASTNMLNLAPPSFAGSYFFDNTLTRQPCSAGTYALYLDKTKRFINTDDVRILLPNAQTADQNYYMLTGQCPVARDLQGLLSALAKNNQLKTSAVALQNYTAFTPDLYAAMVSSTTSFNAVSYTGSATAATLTMSFTGTGVTCTAPTLSFGAGSSFSWTNYPGNFKITGFANLLASGTTGFTVTALIDNNSDGIADVQEVMTGTAGCLTLTCSLPNACAPEPVVVDIINLLNLLSTNGQLNGANVNLSGGSTVYNTFFNNSVLPNYASLASCTPISTNRFWKYTAAGPDYRINCGSANSNTSYLKVVFSSTFAGTVSSFIYQGMASSTAINVLVTYTNASPTTMTITLQSQVAGANENVVIGDCGTLVPQQCEGGPYQRRGDLEALLNAKRSTLTANTPNLSQFSAFTSLLEHAGSGTYSWTAGTISNNSLPITIGNGTQNCTLQLTFAQAPTGTHSFTNITSFGPLLVDETNLVNGDGYNFTITAWYSDNLSELIRGTSCYAIRNCPVCTAPGKSTYENFDLATSSAGTTLSFVAGCPGSTNQYTLTNKIATTCSASTTLTGGDHSNPATGKYVYTNIAPNTTATIWKKEFKPLNNNAGAIQLFTPYTFSVWYTNASTAVYPNGSQFTLQLLVNGTVLKSYNYTVGANAPGPVTGIWQQLSVQWNGAAVTPTDLAPVTVEVRCTTNTTSSWKLAFDDIAFYVPSCDPIPVPMANPTYLYADPCSTNLTDIAALNAALEYEQYIAGVIADFKKDYITRCLSAAVEVFKTSYNFTEYQFTLYYYDQAGNLTRTVPPQGVNIVNLAGDANGAGGPDGPEIKLNRQNGTKTFQTSHRFITTYKYNSLNQLISQRTPDGGITNFWYDRLGRIVASQNAKQAQQVPKRWSYTVYDALGRIKEVGELNASAAPTTAQLAATNFPDNWAGTITANPRTDVTLTYYDVVDPTIGTPVQPFFSSGQQKNLRKRVAHTFHLEYSNMGGTYATHYSYDIHGNVEELVQENPELNSYNNGTVFLRYKQIRYKYDLVSGNVKEVLYQAGQADQFYHRYRYDADNRVVAAFTSSDQVHWDRDAKYFYYLHGPMARTELGQLKVQAMDYAYTIHGWIKGVNSNSLKVEHDMGGDGNKAPAANLNTYIGADEMGYSLGYYQNDYSSIAINPAIASITSSGVTGSGLNAASPNLWNGNIRHMVVSIRQFMNAGTTSPQAFAYKYDQLNRITSAEQYTNMDMSTNVWQVGGAGNTAYKETFTYDHNGNIIRQNRNGNAAQVNLDQLKYFYYNAAGGTYDPEVSTPNNATNQLAYVTDAVTATNYTDDIDNQAANNYTYDQIGQLKSDVQEEISSIEWTVYNKIRSITRTATSTKSDLVFRYDAMGNRILKVTMPRSGSGVKTQDFWTWTYYVRDAQGNVMATYDRTLPRDIPLGTYKDQVVLKEQHIYGSSRVGMAQKDLQMMVFNYNFTAYSGTTLTGTFVSQTTAVASKTNFVHTLGQKAYEMANHLGNVLAVVGDARKTFNTGATVTGFGAVLKSASDYSAFGAPLVGRSYTAPATNYRYGFNGKEKDPEGMGGGGATYDYGFRIYNPSLAKFLSVDPLTSSYPWNSTYAFAENNPIRFIDLDGLEKANPEMFTLAIAQINYLRTEIAKDPSKNSTVVNGVTMEQVLSELEDQVLFAQSGYSNAQTNKLGYYCGKSAAHNDLILYNPMGYVALMTDLFSNGSAQFNGKGKELTVPDDVRSGVSGRISPVDEVFGKTLNASMKNANLTRIMLNGILTNEGNTTPFEYEILLGALGMDVNTSGYYRTFIDADLQAIENAVQSGFLPIVFENHGISTGDADDGAQGRFGIHFIAMHSFKIDGDNVSYTYWHYGRLESNTVSKEQFLTSMKGYWIPETKKEEPKKEE